MLKKNTLLWVGLVSATLLSAQGKPRVFVSTGEPQQITDSAKARGPRNYKTNVVEVQAVFMQWCPEVTVTTEKSKADFSVVIDAGSNQPDRVSVFDKNGDLIFTGSTRMLRNAVKNACNVITKAR
jgi:hypothetical protein